MVANGKAFPDGYTRYDYIESSGSEAIDTGVVAANDLELTAVIAVTVTGLTQNRNYVFGNSVTNSRIQFSYSPSTYFAWGTGVSGTIENADTSKHTLKANSSKFRIDGVAVFTPYDSITTTDKTVYLFARNTGSSVSDYANGLRIYRCTIRKGGALIRDFIPCVRVSDSKPGMYDMVNDQFYVSIGSSDFTAGND